MVQLWPISPLRIQPVTTKEDAAAGAFISYYAYTYDPSKEPEHIPPEDMLHFRLGLDDKDMRLGQSPLARLVQEVAGDAGGAQVADRDAGERRHGRHADHSAVRLEPDDRAGREHEADFEERFGGQNRGRTGVLMGGATAQPYGFSPEQMDMKALHRSPEERIAAVLRVPAIIAGLGAGLDSIDLRQLQRSARDVRRDDA